MSWFQKNTQFSQPSIFYTTNLNETFIFVGLGNPGLKYKATRHNIGFACLDNFTEMTEGFSGWSLKNDLKCQINSASLGDKRLLVIKPTTYMNDSGQAVAAVINFYKLKADRLVVIHDELDISFGQIRARLGGSDAGHNGIKSINELLGTMEYARLRIGIGPKKPTAIDSKDFVLGKFTLAQQKQLPALYKEVNAMLNEYIYGGKLVAETRSFIV